MGAYSLKDLNCKYIKRWLVRMGVIPFSFGRSMDQTDQYIELGFLCGRSDYL